MSTSTISFTDIQRTEIIDKLTPIITQNVESMPVPSDIKQTLRDEGKMQMIIDRQLELLSELNDEKLYTLAKRHHITWTR